MEILRSPFSETASSQRAVAATIGFFDGVHLGHRYLLQQVAQEATQRGFDAMAVTFAHHPRQTLDTDFRPKLLSTPEEKLQLLASCDVDACAVLDFTKELAAMTAEEFMRRILKEQLGVRCLVIGYDHRFGSNRAEGFEDYVRHGARLGIEVVQAQPLRGDDFTVSSSAVRRLLSAGDVEAAKRCLGRSYEIAGTVVEGHRVGRELGFPTANLRPLCAEKIIPAFGVYAVYVETESRTYAAMLNIGRRPTLENGDDASIEAHLFGFEGDLYGKSLTLRFEHRLRDEQKFETLSDLRRQLALDAQATLTLLQA